MCTKFRLALLICASALNLAAQSTVFVSGHADRYGAEPDPDITEVGKKHAEALGSMLAAANVTRIYTTEFVRTQQTAAPTTRRARIKPVLIKQDDFEDLIRQIRAGLKPGESTLVIGRRNTAARIVKALSGKDIPPLGVSEYGRLVAVTLLPGGVSSLVTLQYTE